MSAPSLVMPLLAPSDARVHEPAANAAATITLTGVANRRWVVATLGWSYDAAPTGGSLKIEAPSGTTEWVQSVTAAGPGTFNPLYVAPANTDVVLTLAAGGAGISGKVSVIAFQIKLPGD